MTKRLCILALVFLTVFAAPAYASPTTVADNGWQEQIGAGNVQLVSIGDHRLEVRIQGDGNRTVVFESGLGHDLTVWQSIADEISKSATVVSYSRAGYGQSEPSSQPRTLDQVATELDQLLAAIDISGPLVLVGHSAGGFYIRKFAELNPERVVGLVFVDATPEKILLRLRDLDEKRALEEEAVMTSMTPDRVKPEDVYFSQITSSGLYPASGSLPDVPASFITAMKQEYPQFLMHSVDGKAIWRELQSEFIGQFDDHIHIVSSMSGHNVHREQPELVIDAIQYVLQRTSELEGKR